MPTRFRIGDREHAEIANAIDKIRSAPGLPDRSAILEVLLSAQRRAEASRGSEFAHADETLGENGDDFALSMVLTALEQVPAAQADGAKPATHWFTLRDNPIEPQPRRAVGSPPYSPYSDLDPRWVTALVNVMKADPLPFPARVEGAAADQPGSGIITLKDDVRIAIAGDWGTGNASSLRLAKLMAEKQPHYTIHLGDVYYSGSPAEEQAKFIDPWPAGSLGTFALNSNHEMYSGGAGYFGLTLRNPKFAAQGGLSYFLLQNEDWAIFGLDTAYYSGSALYMHGHLDDVQVEFLEEHGRRALEDRKQVIVLTHHDGLGFDGSSNELWSQVADALGRQGLCYWFWGHVHGAASFKPQTRKYASGPLEIKARCVGHGGVPYGPLDPHQAGVDWAEDQQFVGDEHFPRRALNGFVLLTLRGSHLTEEFWAETGVKRY